MYTQVCFESLLLRRMFISAITIACPFKVCKQDGVKSSIVDNKTLLSQSCETGRDDDDGMRYH